MVAICAHRTAGVYVDRTLQIAAADVALGRKAGLQGRPWKNRSSKAKPSLRCERGVRFTADRGLGP